MALTGPEQQDYKVHAENEKLRLFREEHEEISGGKSGNTAGHYERSANFTREQYNKTLDAEALRRRQAFEDAMFINLLQDINVIIAENESKLLKTNQAIESLEKQISILEKMLEAAENGEVLELTEEQEELIAAFEKEYGITIDRNEPSSIKLALEIAEEEKKLLYRQRQEVEAELELAKQTAEEIERIMEIEDPDLRRVELDVLIESLEVQGEAGERILEAARGHLSEEHKIEVILASQAEADVEVNIKAVKDGPTAHFNRSSLGTTDDGSLGLDSGPADLEVASNEGSRPADLDTGRPVGLG